MLPRRMGRSNLLVDSIITEVHFSAMDAEDMQRIAVACIERPDAAGKMTMSQRFGALGDPAMGSTSTSMPCLTCGELSSACHGHPGYTPLPEPVFNPIHRNTLAAVLRIVCWECGHILAIPHQHAGDAPPPPIVGRLLNAPMAQRTTILTVHTNKAVRSCATCGAARGRATWTKQRAELVLVQGVAGPRTTAIARDVMPILKRIPKEHAMLMGIPKPHALIWEAVPIPPPSIRPHVAVGGGGSSNRGGHSMTQAIADIIRNANLLSAAAAEGKPIDTHLTALQYFVSAHINSETRRPAGVTDRNQNRRKGINQILRGKEGRARGHIMGKRTDQNARSVVSPNSMLLIHELSMPGLIARELSETVMVLPDNIHWLQTLVDTQRARLILKAPLGMEVNLRAAMHTPPRLVVGDRVVRHVMNGDIVLFNRQPTLHKPSMMGHVVRVAPNSSMTFGFNGSTTTPYNADFDGDEMNAHMPQTAVSRAEFRDMMGVTTNIISPTTSSPIIGFLQDMVLGIHLLALCTDLTREECIYMLCSATPQSDTEFALLNRAAQRLGCPDLDLRTGCRVLSAVLPPSLTIQLKDGSASATIVNGVIQPGAVFTKDMLSGNRSILHYVHAICGGNGVPEFMFMVQGLASAFLQCRMTDASIGPRYLTPVKDSRATLTAEVGVIQSGVDALREQCRRGMLASLPGASPLVTLEARIVQRADAIQACAERIIRDAGVPHHPMVVSKSKGGTVNTMQTLLCLGQQKVQGRPGTHMGGRVVPHFPRFSSKLRHHGLVTACLSDGLSATDNIMHNMSARVGLMDTACNTGQIGYLQRRLCKLLEAYAISLDLLVRGDLGMVVQFGYGNCCDPARETCQALWCVTHATEAVGARVSGSSAGAPPGFTVTPAHFVEAVQDVHESGTQWMCGIAAYQTPCEEVAALAAARMWCMREYEGTTAMSSGVNIAFILSEIGGGGDNNGAVSPLMVPALFRLHVGRRMQFVRLMRSVLPNTAPIQHLELLLLQDTMWWPVRRAGVATSTAIHKMWDIVTVRFTSSIAPPGTLVGLLAATGVGEKATQTTLNTFHHTGAGSMQSTISAVNETVNGVHSSKQHNRQIHVRTQPGVAPDVVCRRIHDVRVGDMARGAVELVSMPVGCAAEPAWLRAWTEILVATAGAADRWWPMMVRLSIPSQRAPEGQNTAVDAVVGAIGRVMEASEVAVLWTVAYCVRPGGGGDIAIRLRRGANGVEDEDDAVACLVEAQKVVSKIHVSGVPGVRGLFIDKERKVTMDMHGGEVVTSEYVIRVQNPYVEKHPAAGVFPPATRLPSSSSSNAAPPVSRFMSVLMVEGVDPVRTTSTDPWEVLGMLGIEAAATTIVRQMCEISPSVVEKHVWLLSSAMTVNGTPGSATRHDMNRSGNKSTLQSAVFEEPIGMLANAAVHEKSNRVDPSSTAEHIVLGKVVPTGTAFYTPVFDLSVLAAA